METFCGNIQNVLIVEYNTHARSSQTPVARSLSDVDKMIHDF